MTAWGQSLCLGCFSEAVHGDEEDCCLCDAAAGLLPAPHAPKRPPQACPAPAQGTRGAKRGATWRCCFCLLPASSPVLQGHVEQAAAANARVVGPGDQLASLSGHGLGAGGLLAGGNQGVHQLGRIAGPELRADNQGSLRAPGSANPGRRRKPHAHGAQSASPAFPFPLTFAGEHMLEHGRGLEQRNGRNVGRT
jgi:hypothetical protein